MYKKMGLIVSLTMIILALILFKILNTSNSGAENTYEQALSEDTQIEQEIEEEKFNFLEDTKIQATTPVTPSITTPVTLNTTETWDLNTEYNTTEDIVKTEDLGVGEDKEGIGIINSKDIIRQGNMAYCRIVILVDGYGEIPYYLNQDSYVKINIGDKVKVSYTLYTNLCEENTVMVKTVTSVN